MDNNELYHWGVLGMKWGVRRYQNKDGTLTPAGKRRAAKLEEKRQKLEGQYKKLYGVKPAKTIQQQPEQPQKKTIKDLTDDELRAKYNRLKLESDYKKLYADMNPQKKSFVRKIVDDNKDKVLKDLSDIATKKAKNYLEKKLGLQTTDPLVGLEREFKAINWQVQTAKLKNEYATLKKQNKI